MYVLDAGKSQSESNFKNVFETDVVTFKLNLILEGETVERNLVNSLMNCKVGCVPVCLINYVPREECDTYGWLRLFHCQELSSHSQ